MDDADVVILNTRSIRRMQKRKYMGKLRGKEIKGEEARCPLGIAGCMAQENKGKLIERMPVIDFVIGPYHIHAHLKDIVSAGGQKVRMWS